MTDARIPMPPGERRQAIAGYVAGYRGTHSWCEAVDAGWTFRMAWHDGRRHGGALTPHGARCWLRDTGWFGSRHLDRPSRDFRRNQC